MPSAPAELLDELISRSGLRPTRQGVAATEPEYRFDAERTIGTLAATLAELHRVTIEPDSLRRASEVQLTPQLLVDRAAVRAESASAEGLELGQAYRHIPRPRLVQILSDGADAVTSRGDSVALLQGRPTLDNLLFDHLEVLGFSDWSLATLGDTYWDLALASRDLAARFGPAPIQAFFGEYGLERPDPVRLDWYLLAAELCA